MRKKLGLGIPLWVALKLLALESTGLQRFRFIGSVSLAVSVVTGMIISYICRGFEFFPLCYSSQSEGWS